MGRKLLDNKMAQVNVRLPVPMADQLQALATRENRTLSNYLRGILKRFLESSENAIGGAR